MLFVSPAIAVPPVETVYQRYWPFAPPDAVSVVLAPAQADAPVVEGAAGIALMVSCAPLVKTVAAKSPLTLQR